MRLGLGAGPTSHELPGGPGPSLYRALLEKVGKPGLAKSSIPPQKKAPRYPP